MFYREDQSVASIAKTLDITEEAARQRLSRGRELLRHQAAAMIEGTMVKTRPAAAFTTSVMAAVAVLSDSAKAAMATGTTGVAGSVIAKSTTGLMATGGIVGIDFGQACQSMKAASGRAKRSCSAARSSTSMSAILPVDLICRLVQCRKSLEAGSLLVTVPTAYF